jgi:hypothetical protein
MRRHAVAAEEPMRRVWTPEDLIASWTLVEDDWRLVGNKTGTARLGFALLLKFFELEGRFPRTSTSCHGRRRPAGQGGGDRG